MNLWNTILIGLKEIGSHKFRSLLTMMGIILGVASLVGMSALVKGMENGLKEALVAIGGLEKIRLESEDDLPDYQRHLADQAKGVTLRDVYRLRASAPLVTNIVPFVQRHGYRDSMAVTHRSKRARPYIFAGTWPGALEINEHVIAHGRMFNEIDDEEARSVCVIGTSIRDALFGDPEVTGTEVIPVGESVNINGIPFTIIGMFEHYESEAIQKAKAAAASNPPGNTSTNRNGRSTRYRAKGSHFVYRLKNNTIYIPLKTMVVKFRSAIDTAGIMDAPLSTLEMQIPSVNLLEPALQQVRNVMLLTHNGIEDFEFRTQEDWAEEITATIRNARLSGGIIAAISLLVGGIGIMNIMLASISERVREIGIRKSVGASDAAVFTQILMESLVLALLGGLAGLVASWSLVQLIGAFTPEDNIPVITPEALLIAFLFSAVVGVVAGLIPAVKAARLDPIQALRYE